MTKSGRPPLTAKDLELIRDQIADEALKIFQKEGFDALSMRRLAREAGCSPMTIYAHFDGKSDILRHLWGSVLGRVFARIADLLSEIEYPQDRLRSAAQSFTSHWLDHPDEFRMVFMAGGVTRPDVKTFISEATTLGHFETFSELVAQASVTPTEVKVRSETLIMGMIGIALAYNTIGDYPWSDPAEVVDGLVAGVLRE